MAGDDSAEKKHDPGEKKWREAAERGELPKSADVSAVAVVLAGMLAMTFGSQLIGQQMQEMAVTGFDGGGPYLLDIDIMVGLGHKSLKAILISLVVPLGAVGAAALTANLAQTQMKVSTKALEPKWEKLNAIEGFRNAYLSSTPFVELGKGLGKMFLLFGSVALVMREDIEELPSLAALPAASLLEALVDLGFRTVLAALPILLVLAVGDYAYSYWKTTEQLKRTDKEMRDDMKEQEGDPHMKAHRRARARQIASSVNLAAVAQADVVVTNPTHFAVALRYRRGEDEAPVVLVKGVDDLALRIRAEARQQGVAQVENRRLARALYAEAEVGGAIPEELYAPVAKVLAVVLKRRQGR